MHSQFYAARLINALTAMGIFHVELKRCIAVKKGFVRLKKKRKNLLRTNTYPSGKKLLQSSPIFHTVVYWYTNYKERRLLDWRSRLILGTSQRIIEPLLLVQHSTNFPQNFWLEEGESNTSNWQLKPYRQMQSLSCHKVPSIHICTELIDLVHTFSPVL